MFTATTDRPPRSPDAAPVLAGSPSPTAAGVPLESPTMSMHAVGSVPSTARPVRARSYDSGPAAETIPPPPASVGSESPSGARASESSDPAGASTPPPAAKPAPSGWRRRWQYIWAILCHLFLLLLIPTFFLGLSLTFLVWQLKGKTDRLVEDQGREALNFQINVALLTAILGISFIGLPLVPIVWLVAAILALIAARTASDGRSYRYPLVLRIVSH